MIRQTIKPLCQPHFGSFTLSKMGLTRIFVYGTLKRGQPNHGLLVLPNNEQAGKAEFVGTAKTIDKYPLIIATKFNTPFLLDVVGSGQRVVGEIYQVDDVMLEECDQLEGHPERYVRTPIQVERDDSSIEQVFCYLLPRNRFPEHLLQFPTFESYDSFGDHGKAYVRCTNLEEKVSDPDLLIDSWKRIKTNQVPK